MLREESHLEREAIAIIRLCDQRLAERRPRFSPLFVVAMKERLERALDRDLRAREEGTHA